MFAGLGQDVVPYLASLNIHCPRHYNPADFSKFMLFVYSNKAIVIIVLQMFNITCNNISAVKIDQKEAQRRLHTKMPKEPYNFVSH